MRIDIHGHVSAPAELYAYKANILAHRGAHGRGGARMSDDMLRAALTEPNHNFGDVSHLEHLAGAGVDLQLISPRPYAMMHSETPATLVAWFTEEVNDTIARVCALYPGQFRGVAGLPQSMDLPPGRWVDELRRAVTDLGFVGALLNPDPYEGMATPPRLSDPFWYPVYEALCELDVPAIIHSAGCRPPARQSYSLHFILEETIAVATLLASPVFDDFPDLKLVVSHGGGAIPYQAGRFMPGAVRRPGAAPFTERMRRLWYDTCLYTRDALELLFATVGPDRCLFGTEKPGTGSQRDPATGRWFDDIHLLIDEIGLDEAARQAVYEDNARALFKL